MGGLTIEVTDVTDLVNAKLRVDPERIRHFVKRFAEMGVNPREEFIVSLCMDDPCGAALGDALIPGRDSAWDEIRAQGGIPFARGIATIGVLADGLAEHAPNAARRLAELRATGTIAVLVMDLNTVAVYPASDFDATSTQGETS